MFFRGGIRIGSSYLSSLNYTWPFAKVMFENDCLRIVVSFVRRTEYIILYKNVTKVSYKKVFSAEVLL